MFKKYLSSIKPHVDSSIEAALGSFDSEWFTKHLGELEYGYEPKVFGVIHNPVKELLASGGKRWRPIFMMVCCDALGGGSKIMDLVPIIEILHNATLMIDDIEDDSDTRRGRPAAHITHGVDVAINSGNLLYYLPFVMLEKTSFSPVVKRRLSIAISEEMLRLHFGQGMDIAWHNGHATPTEELYYQMCSFKTGSLARMAARFACIVAKANPTVEKKIVRFAESLGIAFQIQDDILNIEGTVGKSFGDDITEGKRSLMVIHSASKRKSKLIDILNRKTRDEEEIKEAIDIMNRTGSVEYAKKRAVEIVEDAWSGLEEYRNTKLNLFAEFVTKRRY
jgi:geranylgeranyl pyrophosphate synthase